MFKSAFISILGFPNAGKSTLLNTILKDSLVITNKKAQTTRHRIKGIVNAEDHQLVFSDTPGIIKESAYLMQDYMMKAVNESLEDADILLLVLDTTSFKDIHELKAFIKDHKSPVIVAINKVDLSQQEEVEKQMKEAAEILETEFVFPISALEKYNTENIVEKILELAPEHPPYYDQDVITDQNTRFIVSEIIRDHMLTLFDKEIPYSAEVVVEDYKDTPKIDKIYATIYLERDSQKVIVLGKGGSAIKKLGTRSRQDIEKFIQKKVFLALTVKIRKNWRKDELQLKRFGYIK